MRSSLISPGLLNSLIGRFLPLWLAFFAAWMVCLVLPLATFAPAVTDAFAPYVAGWSMEYYGSLVGCAIAAIVSVCNVFEYLFNRQAAVFAGTMPVKRNALFATAYLAGLLPLLAVELAVFAIVVLMSFALPQIGVQFVASWLGVSAGFTFVFYSIAAFCAQLAGTRTAAYYLYLLINAFAMFIEFTCRSIGSVLMWGVEFGSGDFLFMWASPFFGLAYYVFDAAHSIASMTVTINWFTLLAYSAAAVLFTAASAVLNKRRHLERAENPVAVAAVPVAGKVMGALGLAALASLICQFCLWFNSGGQQVLTDGQVTLLACVAALAALAGAFFAHACLLGGKGSLKGSLRIGVICAVCCLAFIVGCRMDVLGLESKVPASDEVASVTVTLDDTSTTLASEEGITVVTAAHKQVLEARGEAAPAEGLSADYYEDLAISYTLKNGAKLRSSYRVAQYNTMLSSHAGEPKKIDRAVFGLKSMLDSEEGVMSRFDALAQSDLKYCSITISYGEGEDSDTYGEIAIESDEVTSYVNDALLVDVHKNGFGKIYESEGEAVGFVNATYLSSEHEYPSIEADLYQGNCKAQAKWMKEHYGVDILE